MAKNQGNSVQKSGSPEEQAILANVAALVEELMGMSAGAGNVPNQEPGAGDGLGAPPVQKGSEQGRQEGADQVMAPKAAPADRGLAPWNDNEDVKKAFATIAKAMQASTSDGPTANDKAQARVEDLPDSDKENIAEVAKALAALINKKGVAKSMGAVQQPAANPLTEVLTVMKSMADRMERQDAIIGEILDGLGVADGVQGNAPASTVQKSQSGAAPANRPVGSLDGGNLVETIAMAVAKSLQMTNSLQRPSGIAVAKGFEGERVNEDVRDFAEAFTESAQDRWNVPVQN